MPLFRKRAPAQKPLYPADRALNEKEAYAVLLGKHKLEMREISGLGEAFASNAIEGIPRPRTEAEWDALAERIKEGRAGNDEKRPLAGFEAGVLLRRENLLPKEILKAPLPGIRRKEGAPVTRGEWLEWAAAVKRERRFGDRVKAFFHRFKR